MKIQITVLFILLSLSACLHAIDKPYFVSFGRGSGQVGLAVVTFDSAGSARILRGNEVCKFQISPDTIASLSKAIDQLNLLGLEKRYDGNMRDGTQWILTISTETESHTTYFDNLFPESIQQFSKLLDETFSDSFLRKQKRNQISPAEAGAIQKRLWDAIKES